MEGRVKEAVAKIATREKPMTAASLRAELDMGPKEWGRYTLPLLRSLLALRRRLGGADALLTRYGSDVMNAVGQLRYQKFWAPPDNGPLGLLLVGIPASGYYHCPPPFIQAVFALIRLLFWAEGLTRDCMFFTLSTARRRSPRGWPSADGYASVRMTTRAMWSARLTC
jgi:hypothetical protein